MATHAGGRDGYGYEYAVTNIEYTEFKRLGIQDEAQAGGSQLSVFPANTNVLYVNLKVHLREFPHIRISVGYSRGFSNLWPVNYCR